ncbi:DNA translocase FtsK 4TM domain-containing protein [Brachyspira aalborgi]|uniref:DNA translocase FtsK n=1 Tax=Brachyspira aalborgi TaxID=29522 RepID=A0A5C8EJC9_9SPIR|nr:DNA translocase FtsK 4TM domain-containing protein [Brachyspira aalborgi]TXJ37885.1 DNA translocase FtsK [Brachyspira aalborgi]
MIKFNKNNYNNRNSIFDVVGFLCLLFAGILLLSYFSINKESITLNDNISKNLLGIFGAYISVYSFLAFGYSSFIFPAFFIYVGISVILKNSSNKISLSALASFILMILLSVLFDITLGESLFYKKGGMMGKVIGESLISLFGKTGAFVMVISGLIILTIIFAKVSIIDSLNSLKNILGKIDLKKIKDFESKIINENINKTNSDNNENEKLKTKDYLPIFYKKEVPEISFSSIPFIEKVKQSNNYFNSFSFNEDDFREKLKRKNNSFESFFSGLKKSSDYNNDDKKIDSIVNGLKNNNFNVNTMESEEEDLGTSLAKAVFGNDYKNNIERKNNDFLSNYSLNNKNDSLNNFKDEEELELDFNINRARVSEFKRAIYEDSIYSKYARYDKTDNFIKANRTISDDYSEYLLRKKYKENNSNNFLNKEEDNLQSYNLEEHNFENKIDKKEELNRKKEDILSKLRNMVNKNKELNYNKEYVSASDLDKPFEFNMGYASKREYNRADHIPTNYNNYNSDDKLEDFDLDEEELYNTNNNYIEDVKIKEIDNHFIDENKNAFNNFNNAENTNFREIKENNNELATFINIESDKKVNIINDNHKAIIRKHSDDLDLIQSNFDAKYVDKHYKHPPFDLLNRAIPINDNAMMESIKQTALQLENTLLDFNIEAKVTGVSRGPVITRYELELAAGTRVSKISNLTDNIALALASESVRIIAPIPGRSVIGIEIPNKVRNAVYLREVLESVDFRNSKLDIPFVLGKGIYGNNVVSDMSEAPHLLVAGTTGSGKSVCLSTIILSLLYKFRPDELKFIFVDKKRVELSIYNGIPHLMSPVVSDEKKATIVLRYIVDIMEKRYERMERFFVRNVKTYNEKVKQLIKEGETEFNGEPLELFPYIVLVIDELHNLMVVASKEVEDLISRLAGMSRAVGIHLIIATQRPSADVVTGVIKANLPTRVAFQVPNKTNSRIIIDMSGAEQLLGKGDALFCASGSQMPERIQGAFVSDNEVKKVVDYLSGEMSPMFDESLIAALEGSDGDDRNSDEENILDEELWEDAVKLVTRTGKASASFLQRRLKIGYNRAARIIEIMERQGIVGPENGSKPREVLISLEE